MTREEVKQKLLALGFDMNEVHYLLHSRNGVVYYRTASQTIAEKIKNSGLNVTVVPERKMIRIIFN